MKDKINGGATLWARQTIESEIFYNKPDKWFKIWFYLVNKVKWQDGKQFKKGQCFMKYEWITEATGANKNQIDHCIRWLKSATQIATQKATRGFIVTICNYNTYQSLESYKSETESDLKAKQKRHRSDTILKKGNKDKKDNIKEIYKEKMVDTKQTKQTTTKETIQKKGEFEVIWNKYPKRDGKKDAYKHFNASVTSDKDWQDINTALGNYLNSERVSNGYIKNGSTWFNNWRDWIDYTEPSKKETKQPLTETEKTELMLARRKLHGNNS